MPPNFAVGLIGKNRLLRDAFRALLDGSGTFTVAFERTGDEQPLISEDTPPPQAVLLLLVGGSEHNLAMFQCLSELADRTNVLVLTGESDPGLHADAIELGGRGVILLDAGGDVLLKALTKVCAGELWLNRSGTASIVARLTRRRGDGEDPEMVKIESLTAREREIIGLVTEGLTNGGVASKLFISEATARNHMTSILDKLDVTDRFQLAVYAFRQGLVLCPPTPAMLRVAATMMPPRALPMSARGNGVRPSTRPVGLTGTATAAMQRRKTG